MNNKNGNSPSYFSIRQNQNVFTRKLFRWVFVEFLQIAHARAAHKIGVEHISIKYAAKPLGHIVPITSISKLINFSIVPINARIRRIVVPILRLNVGFTFFRSRKFTLILFSRVASNDQFWETTLNITFYCFFLTKGDFPSMELSLPWATEGPPYSPPFFFEILKSFKNID